MLKEQNHRKIVHDIIKKSFLENYQGDCMGFLLEPSTGKLYDDIFKLYKLLDNYGEHDLCLQIIPCFEFDNAKSLTAIIFKYQKKEEFSQILYQSIMTNADLLKTSCDDYWDYAYSVYRKSQAVLPPQQARALEATIFKKFISGNIREENIDTLIFTIDKLSLLKYVNDNVTDYAFPVDSFIKFLKSSFIKEELLFSMMLEILKEPHYIQLLFVDPQDKALIRKFVEHLPLLFQEFIQSDMPEKQKHMMQKHLAAIKMDVALPLKSSHRNIKL